MPHINWKSVSYIINYYLTQWTNNRMPDKRGTDNRGSTVLCCRQVVMNVKDYLARINYSGSLKPDLKTLNDLTWAYKTSIPFTNVEYINNQGVV